MQGIYSVSKAALIMLTKVMAKELGGQGVRVNCICPGLIKTRLSEAIWANPDLASRSHKEGPGADWIARRVGRRRNLSGIRCEFVYDGRGAADRWGDDYLIHTPLVRPPVPSP